ncbi:uncharacterized protein LOC111342930 [Stylophora pistillata]|uniref:uncharacterized protein LOC111342930 n=1 Tax=Stylophora pistillata TaxID=50429 RepID=UPI000C04557D|nr:uncharacterized protein LOC111342930 [Stylophora pistillata]
MWCRLCSMFIRKEKKHYTTSSSFATPRVWSDTISKKRNLMYRRKVKEKMLRFLWKNFHPVFITKAFMRKVHWFTLYSSVLNENIGDMSLNFENQLKFSVLIFVSLCG